MTECDICVETITKRNPSITCGHCSSLVCRVCAKRYLIGSIQTAHCMSCKKAWSNKFMVDNFPKAWLHGEYRQSRQKLYVDREKALLPQTLSVHQQRVTNENAIEKLEEEAREINKQIAILKIQLIQKRQEIHNLRFNDKAASVAAPKVSFMFPCSKEDCRGFIEAIKWKCGLCNTKICKSCHAVKVKDVKHECKKDDIDTAKMIVKETKPCPNCKTRIFKINGCDQIFCTSCHTAFSWDKGTIEKGVIHNPHFFELQRKMGTVQRNIRDVPCGGADMMTIRPARSSVHYKYFQNIVERLGEINNRIAYMHERDFLEIRINYLRGKLTSRAFRSSIFRVERANEKQREERQILETFRVAVIERLNTLTDTNCLEIKKDIENIRKFCNAAFEENYTILGYTTWPRIIVD